MEAVRLAFRAELRRRWRSWLAIALLISVVGGFVLGRRGRRSSYGIRVPTVRRCPRLRRRRVRQPTRAQGRQASRGRLRHTARRPVQRSTDMRLHPPDQPDGLRRRRRRPQGRSPFQARLGHLPDPSAPDQVLASFTLQQDYGVQTRDRDPRPVLRSSQASAFNNATGAPPEPRRVRPLPSAWSGSKPPNTSSPPGRPLPYVLYATPAFARTVVPRTAIGYLYFVRLRHGAADLPDSSAQAS